MRCLKSDKNKAIIYSAITFLYVVLEKKIGNINIIGAMWELLPYLAFGIGICLALSFYDKERILGRVLSIILLLCVIAICLLSYYATYEIQNNKGYIGRGILLVLVILFLILVYVCHRKGYREPQLDEEALREFGKNNIVYVFWWWVYLVVYLIGMIGLPLIIRIIKPEISSIFLVYTIFGCILVYVSYCIAYALGYSGFKMYKLIILYSFIGIIGWFTDAIYNVIPSITQTRFTIYFFPFVIETIGIMPFLLYHLRFKKHE